MMKFKQNFAPFFCLAIGSIVSILVFLQIEKLDTHERRSAFDHQADTHFSTVEEQLFATQDILSSLKAFIENNDVLKRSQFDNFAKSLMSRHQDIQALEWIPKIPHHKKLESEQSARNEGLEGFSIRERKSGTLEDVTHRDYYFPVYYVYPYKNNKAAVGFDLGSNPARLKALELARDTGEIVMTRRITLVQEAASQAGVLMFFALYEGGITPATTAEKRENLLGFVLTVIRVGDLIEQSRAKLQPNIDFSVNDADSQESLHDSRQNPDSVEVFSKNYVREVGLRQWSFDLFPKPGSAFLRKSPQKWFALFGIFSISFLLSLYLFLLVRSRGKIQQEVSRRTEELASSEQRFVLATQGSSVGLWDWQTKDGDKEYWSPQFYKLLDYYQGDIDPTATNFQDLIHPEDKEMTAKRLRAHIEGKQSFEVEFRLRTKNGNYKWFLGTGMAALYDNGKLKRMVGSIQDIHGRKSAEISINAYAKDLKRSNADLEHFAYVASHDLKAPLRGIFNLATWIEGNIKDTMDEETDSYMSLLKNRVKRLETLLASLLEYSRVGQNIEEQNKTDLNELISGISDLLSASEQGFQINHDIPNLQVPTAMLNQVFHNLINNSMKHHDKDEGQIDLKYEASGKEHIFSVTDDGPGIPEDMYGKVFEMFQTLRPRDEVEGSGMGLAIVKKLVNCHDGKIWLEKNSDSHGTTVKFTVPMEQKLNQIEEALDG